MTTLTVTDGSNSVTTVTTSISGGNTLKPKTVIINNLPKYRTFIGQFKDVGKASNDLKTSPKPPNSREALPMNPTVNSASTNRNEDPVSSNLPVEKCRWKLSDWKI